MAAKKMYANEPISAEDIAEVIAFAPARPHGVSLDEILIGPTAQALQRKTRREEPRCRSPEAP